MSVEIKLNRQAVAQLIAEDESLHFELSRAVVSEVVQKLFDKDLGKIMAAAQPELFKAALDAIATHEEFTSRVTKLLNSRIAVKPPGYAYTFKLTPEFQKIVDAEVDTQITTGITALVKDIVEAKLADVDMDARVAARFDRMVDQEIDRRVREHHETLLKKMREALG